MIAPSMASEPPIERVTLAIEMVALVGFQKRAGRGGKLQLYDIDWRAGEIVVRGKGKCTERLPLPSNLGISAQHFGRSRNVAVSASQSSQSADFAIAHDSSGEG